MSPAPVCPWECALAVLYARNPFIDLEPQTKRTKKKNKRTKKKTKKTKEPTKTKRTKKTKQKQKNQKTQLHETLGLGTPWPETLRLLFFLVLWVFLVLLFFLALLFFLFFCFSGSFGFVCLLGCFDSDYVVCAVRGDLSASSTVNAHSQGPPFCCYRCLVKYRDLNHYQYYFEGFLLISIVLRTLYCLHRVPVPELELG